MRTRHCFLTAAVVATALTIGAASASAELYTWTGGSGNWHEPSHWISSRPGTIPDSTDDDAVIAGPGTFTVTVNSIPGRFLGSGFNIRSLVLGDSASGTQEVLIKTDADTAYGSGLYLSAPSTITPHGMITIEQDPSSGPGLNQPQLIAYADLTNQGTIRARMVAPGGNGTSITGPGTLVNSGTLHVQSGQLQTRTIANTGTIRTDAGARLYASSTGGQGRGVTMASGTIVNDGEIVNDGNTWVQLGGALTGNPVEISNSGLEDSGGTGAFVLTYGNRLAGTIPAGQTVTIGRRAAEHGNSVNVQDPGVTVARGATLVFSGPPANGADMHGRGVTVEGTLRVAMPRAATAGSNDGAFLQGGLAIRAGGVVEVQPDSRLALAPYNQTPMPVYTNDGTLSIAPAGEVMISVSSEDSFVNGPGARIDFGIASPTRFGRITRVGGSVALGGTANGVLAAGYTPAVGTAFSVVQAPTTGAWAAVGGGFTARYSTDPASASLVYTGDTPTPTPIPTPTPTPTPRPRPTPADKKAPALRRLTASATSVGFSSSEAGRAKLSITRTAAGRKVKGTCVPERPANRRKPRCRRTVTVASKTVTVAAGTSSIKLPKLAPGHYAATVKLTDAAGNRATPLTTTLVVKAKPKRPARR